MSLKSEIPPYVDEDGLVSCSLVAPGTVAASQNGTMFTSEYNVMLQKLGQAEQADNDRWEQVMLTCMLQPGLTIRDPQDHETDSPDNHLAMCDGSQTLNKPDIASQILSYGYHNFGWFNPSNPGSIRNTAGQIDWATFLWRQPQLLVAAAAASKRLNILHFPLVLYAAFTILVTGLKVFPASNTDARRLCWHLIQCMSPHSFLCRMAAKVWYWRLSKDYGPVLMKGVAVLYYQTNPEHPFIKYWVS